MTQISKQCCDCPQPASFLMLYRGKQDLRYFFVCDDHLVNLLRVGTAWDLVVRVLRASCYYLVMKEDGTLYENS